MDVSTLADRGRNTLLAGATVFIVDDDADLRSLLSRIVRSAGYLDEAYSTANEFLDHYDPNKRGCLLLDVCMPGISGIELQQRLNSQEIALPIIFITAHGEVSVVTQAIRSGAVDVLAKPFHSETLLQRIHEAVHIDVANRQRHALKSELRQRFSRLTEREHEIMRLLATGESAKHIGHTLSISPKTVENHRAKVLEKMSVDNPTQLAHLLAMLD